MNAIRRHTSLPQICVTGSPYIAITHFMRPRWGNEAGDNSKVFANGLGLGLGLQVLYSATNCTGNILGRFTHITSNRTRLQCSRYKQYIFNTITKKQRYGKIILYKESESIAAVMSIWRYVFSWLIIYINSMRELLAVVLNPALSKWSATVVICTPLQNTYIVASQIP